MPRHEQKEFGDEQHRHGCPRSEDSVVTLGQPALSERRGMQKLRKGCSSNVTDKVMGKDDDDAQARTDCVVVSSG